MEITILTLGKTKNIYLQEMEKYYLDKLKYYTKLNYIVLKEKSINSKKPKKEIINRQTKKISEWINKNTNNYYKILLDTQGVKMSSEEFSLFLKHSQETNKHILFIIGSTWGFNPDIKNYVDFILSFSKLTFPHELVRTLLFEQLFRAYTIMLNINYHK
jgi:23S rRNA (pseudouridine1915-N3)-methyltransferase